LKRALTPRWKFLDNLGGEDEYERLTGSVMNRLSCRASILLAMLAFLTVSTAALAHGHAEVNPANESRCVMCMAAHGATHLIASPALALHFAPVQVGVLVSAEQICVFYAQQFSIQGRAPPLS
jgi:hypothetical protein